MTGMGGRKDWGRQCDYCRKRTEHTTLAETKHTALVDDKAGMTREYILVHVECNQCHRTSAFEKKD